MGRQNTRWNIRKSFYIPLLALRPPCPEDHETAGSVVCRKSKLDQGHCERQVLCTGEEEGSVIEPVGRSNSEQADEEEERKVKAGSLSRGSAGLAIRTESCT